MHSFQGKWKSSAKFVWDNMVPWSNRFHILRTLCIWLMKKKAKMKLLWWLQRQNEHSICVLFFTAIFFAHVKNIGVSIPLLHPKKGTSKHAIGRRRKKTAQTAVPNTPTFASRSEYICVWPHSISFFQANSFIVFVISTQWTLTPWREWLWRAHKNLSTS